MDNLCFATSQSEEFKSAQLQKDLMTKKLRFLYSDGSTSPEELASAEAEIKQKEGEIALLAKSIAQTRKDFEKKLQHVRFFFSRSTWFSQAVFFCFFVL